MYIRAGLVLLALVLGFFLYQHLVAFIYPNPTFSSTRSFIVESMLTSAAFGMLAIAILLRVKEKGWLYLRFALMNLTLALVVFSGIMLYLRAGFSSFSSGLSPRFEELSVPAENIRVFLAPTAAAIVVVLVYLYG